MIVLAAHFPRCYVVLFIGDQSNNKVRALDLPTSMVVLSAVASCCRVNDATISVCDSGSSFSARVFRLPPMLAVVLLHPATAHSVRPFAIRFLQAHLSFCSACTASAGLKSAVCVIVDSSGTMFVSGYCSNVTLIHNVLVYVYCGFILQSCIVSVFDVRPKIWQSTSLFMPQWCLSG
jgi:hypothetical protein